MIGRGAWRGAASARAEGPHAFLPTRGRPKHQVKQAAPGNCPARCFVQRSVRLSNLRTPTKQTTRWVIRGSRLLTPCFGLPRTGKNLRGRWARAKAAPLQAPRPIIREPRPTRLGGPASTSHQSLLTKAAALRASVENPAASSSLPLLSAVSPRRR
jgi:hypothetical protein